MAQPPAKSPIWFGLLFMAVGASMMVMMAVSQEGLNAPLWVAEVAAAAFFFAGVAICAQTLQWLMVQRLSALAIVYCLAVPGLWIMLGADNGSCSATTSFISREAGNLECRIVFGIGGLITLAIALSMTIAIMRMIWRRLRT